MITLLGGLVLLDWWLGRADVWVVQMPDNLQWRPLEAVPLAVVTLVLLVVSFRELSVLARAGGVKLLPISGILLAVVLGIHPVLERLCPPLCVYFEMGSISHSAASVGMMLFGGMVLAFVEQMARRRTDDAMRCIGCTLLAGVYLGIGAMMILTIRISYGVGMLMLFLAAVKCTDIGAYFTGSAVGRHKLIRWLSPGKSWEGLAGGLATAAGVSMLAVWLGRIETIAFWQAAVFGVVIGLAGQFGDLCESLLKRSAGAKDSGAAVPQFGGALDILDSPLIAAPVAVILLDLMT